MFLFTSIHEHVSNVISNAQQSSDHCIGLVHTHVQNSQKLLNVESTSSINSSTLPELLPDFEIAKILEKFISTKKHDRFRTML